MPPRRAVLLRLGLTGSLLVGFSASAEEAERDGAYTRDVSIIEDHIVVGTRHAPRSERDSASPVDVLNSEQLRSQAAVDMDDIQRHGIDDEAILLRPPTLRGLPPEHLLVNGKRRHRSGAIALRGSSLSTGSQGPDIGVIPAIALAQMELLRDGAAAQYGSDAIAGDQNLRLREASESVLLEGNASLSGARSNIIASLGPDAPTAFRPPDCIQSEIADNLQIETGLRSEGFSKLSALWMAEDRINLLSTVSTGCRAPSPGQANLRAVTTGCPGTGGLTNQGQVPPTHPVAAALGGVEFTEEKSEGFSVVTAMEVADDLDLTIDFYDIANEDHAFGGRYLGAQNILDSVPETEPGETAGQGNLLPESSPWDYSGAFWYTRLSV